ncbi:RidA family protein [Streptomyces sp. uw30]|uniref:RidA family protein n=1 Tax=Streptomyces sp. uw30 TaxID=1828179 RepID=UPI0011CED2A9|nr:RidA family protein [Streptomyces sp. uw30]TXS39754.1 RidA family protein [Streptomyces sp. uw30]
MSVQRVNPPAIYGPAGMISQVVTTGGERLVHLSGQVARDAEGRPVGPGDHAAQAAQVVRNIEAALAAVGATRDDIVKETVYVVDYSPALLPAIFGPLRAGVSQAPASTLVGVPALFAPEYLLEVEVVAALRAAPAAPVPAAEDVMSPVPPTGREC